MLKLLIIFFILTINIYATNILILNSYSISNTWTKGQVNANLKTLKNSKLDNLNIYIEFMDTKKFRLNNNVEENFLTFYKNKYKNINFDIIITSDDNAINFVKKYKSIPLFKNTKVFFSGVNNLSLYKQLDKETYAGVFEKKDAVGNLNLAKKLNPKLNTIYLISDDGVSANKNIKFYKNEYKDIKNIKFVYLNSQNIEDIILKLKNYDKNSIAILLTFHSFQKNNISISSHKFIDILIKYYKQPLLTHTSSYTNSYPNIVGGNCTDSTNHGRISASLVVNFIINKNMLHIPYIHKSPNTTYINVKELLKFNIDYSKFNNKKYTLINNKLSFLDKYALVIKIILFLFILFTIVMLIILNKSKSKIIQKEIDKNRKKDLYMIEQSKLAQMGEMIGHIAHQWRQPLSTISTISSSIQLRKELDGLEDAVLFEQMNQITDKTVYLSEIINTFSNFLKINKIKEKVTIEKELKNTIKIIIFVLDNLNIKLKENINYNNNTFATIIPQELAEVLINILNNAKDILVENKTKNPEIILSLKEDSNNIIISIEDNAGGVPNDIINKIFTPYFTTKHHSQGTGLGLYMSNRIVTESLNGKLTVINTKNGANFKICFPKNN